MSSVRADHGYLETMDVKLVAGRYLLPSDHFDNFDDVKSVVINVNAVRLLGLKSGEDAVGREIFWDTREDRRFTIVGVVGDYHQESLQKPMEAIVFFPAYGTFPTSIRVNTTDLQPVISGVEHVYEKFFAGNSFEYFFLEDRYNDQYKDDKRFGKIVNIFTVLAIIVACLGLIGLSSYTAALRTKEIGIRKVLGASVSNLITILSADFVKLVLAASVLALPIAYFAMNKWLESYTYRITTNWIFFVLPLLAILIISAFTISFQVLKTAMTNPVDTLKNE
jgi:putative ABC transport system permease protein